MFFYSHLVKQWLVDLQLLILVCVGFLSYLHFSAIQYAADLEQSDVWDAATTQTYGHKLDQFGVLGDDGLLVQWATPENLGKDCSAYSECNFVRLASMVPCVKGYRLDIEILDAFDKTVSKETLPPTIVPVGSIQAMEIDYRAVSKGGSVLLTGANCSDSFPSL